MICLESMVFFLQREDFLLKCFRVAFLVLSVLVVSPESYALFKKKMKCYGATGECLDLCHKRYKLQDDYIDNLKSIVYEGVKRAIVPSRIDNQTAETLKEFTDKEALFVQHLRDAIALGDRRRNLGCPGPNPSLSEKGVTILKGLMDELLRAIRVKECNIKEYPEDVKCRHLSMDVPKNLFGLTRYIAKAIKTGRAYADGDKPYADGLVEQSDITSSMLQVVRKIVEARIRSKKKQCVSD